VIKTNADRGGKRLDADLEAFAAAVRDMTHGVRRGYVYYQTCRGAKTFRCGAHELVVCPSPTLWHDAEPLPAHIDPWLPSYQPSVDFATAARLPHLITWDIITHAGIGVGVDVWFHREWGAVSVGDFIASMWNLHADHAATCGAPLDDPVHRVGKRNLDHALEHGTAHVNNTFRAINGVAHTDTDLLLVDPSGVPLLIVEEYRPYIDPKTGREDKKYITFSRSLSAQAGGGLVVLVRSDGHPDGPLLEEVWDTRAGVQLVGVSHGVRGYPALLEALRRSALFAPHLTH